MSTVVAQEIIFIVLFIFYFWLCFVFVAARELSRVAASQASPPVVVHGLLTQGLLLLQSLGFRCTGFSSCGHGGLSCPAPHGIFLDQGSNLYLLPWRVDSYSYYYLIEG